MITTTPLTIYIYWVLLPLFVFINPGVNSIQAQEDIAIPDHAAWTQLLEKYVDANGMVNYKSMRQVAGEVAVYLRYLETFSPDLAWPKNRNLAYFINLYNAGTVKLILDHYPIYSIRDIQNPWGQKIFTINDTALSLDDVEHKILRSLQDPRIHFAINCASISCPKLRNSAFSEIGIDKELNEAVSIIFEDPKMFQKRNNEIYLSSIFKWYREDFETVYGSLVNFLNHFHDVPFRENVKLRFLKYNWELNEGK
jgi:hypothetical protein